MAFRRPRCGHYAAAISAAYASDAKTCCNSGGRCLRVATRCSSCSSITCLSLQSPDTPLLVGRCMGASRPALEQHAGRRPVAVRGPGPSPPQAAQQRDPTRRAHIPSQTCAKTRERGRDNVRRGALGGVPVAPLRSRLRPLATSSGLIPTQGRASAAAPPTETGPTSRRRGSRLLGGGRRPAAPALRPGIAHAADNKRSVATGCTSSGSGPRRCALTATPPVPCTSSRGAWATIPHDPPQYVRAPAPALGRAGSPETLAAVLADKPMAETPLSEPCKMAC